MHRQARRLLAQLQLCGLLLIEPPAACAVRRRDADRVDLAEVAVVDDHMGAAVVLFVDIRQREIDDLAARQAIRIDPQLALSGHLGQLRRRGKAHAGRHLACQLLRQHVAHVFGEPLPVDVEGDPLELLAACLYRLQLALVLGGHQESKVVGVGGTHAGRVFHRRQCVAAREVGLVAVAQQPHRIHVIDLCLHPKLHIGAARQLHFSIQMQADFLALLAQVADRGLGDEELVDVGPKGV